MKRTERLEAHVRGFEHVGLVRLEHEQLVRLGRDRQVLVQRADLRIQRPMISGEKQDPARPYRDVAHARCVTLQRRELAGLRVLILLVGFVRLREREPTDR